MLTRHLRSCLGVWVALALAAGCLAAAPLERKPPRPFRGISQRPAPSLAALERTGWFPWNTLTAFRPGEDLNLRLVPTGTPAPDRPAARRDPLAPACRF